MSDGHRVKTEYFNTYLGNLMEKLNAKESMYWSKKNILQYVPSKCDGRVDHYNYYLNRMLECAYQNIDDSFYAVNNKTLYSVSKTANDPHFKDFAFLDAYRASIRKIMESEWEIPECLVNMYFTTLDAWRELPHRSITDREMLAYYRTEDDYLRNRLTKTKPARYFVAKAWGKESEALDFNNSWVSTGADVAKLFLLSELEGGCSQENWKWVYANTDTDTNSCMIKCSDAARVYAFDKTLDLAYFTEDNTPKGNVITRTILRTDIKKYIRIYYTDYRQEKMMQLLLQGKGYTVERDMNGVKLGIVPRTAAGGNSFWMPYVDGNSQYAIKKDDHFLVVDYDEAEDSDDVYEVDDAQGYLFVRSKCRCGNMSRDFNPFVTVVDNQEVTLDLCPRCTRNAVWDDDTEKYYDSEHFMFCMLLDEYDSSRRMTRETNGLVVEPEGHVRVTDKNLISHYGANDTTCTGLFVVKKDAVTLYDGSIGSQARTWRPRVSQKLIERIGKEVWENFKMSSADYRLRDEFNKCYWDGEKKHENQVIRTLVRLRVIPEGFLDNQMYDADHFVHGKYEIKRSSENGVITYQVENVFEKQKIGGFYTDELVDLIRNKYVTSRII